MSSIKETLKANLQLITQEEAELIKNELEKNIKIIKEKVLSDKSKCYDLNMKIDGYYRKLNDRVCEMIINRIMDF